MPLDRSVRANRNPYNNDRIGTPTVTVGVEGSNAINVAIQLGTPAGNDLAGTAGGGSVFAYLSDDASGQTIAASAPSGGWAIGTDGLLIPVVANKAAMLVSENDGDIDVTITETTTKTFYLVIVLPGGGLQVTAIAFA